MKKLTINASSQYDIYIGSKLLDTCGKMIQESLSPARAFVVTDSNVAPLYLEKVISTLNNCGIKTHSHVFPAGEESKRLSTAESVLSDFAKAGLTRNDIAIALGGGVCGDLCGFCCAVYMRGIRFVQLPTTLLAMVDSSVGGKTAVDTEFGKNLIGAFHQPSLVICDVDTLSTLPERYMRDGMAEVIKYGCICDKELFCDLEKRNEADLYNNIEDISYRSIATKKKFVEADEFDTGCRMALNFGHTFGHSLEKACDFKGYSHGEAVGIGMIIASRAGEINGDTAPGCTDRISKLLTKYNLPCKAENHDALTLFAGIANDKKASGSSVCFVLIKDIGEYTLKKMELEKTAMEYFCKS